MHSTLAANSHTGSESNTVRTISYSDVRMCGGVNWQTPTLLDLRHLQARCSRMLLPSLSILLTIMTLTAAQLVFPNLDHEQLAAAMQTHDDKPYDDFVRAPRLSDVMTLEPQASIFFSYARESARFSRILSGEAGSEDGDWDGDRDDGDGNGDGKMYTVFVPMNRAVMALPRKPCVASAGGSVGGVRLTTLVGWYGWQTSRPRAKGRDSG